jgi:hypothetical protein
MTTSLLADGERTRDVRQNHRHLAQDIREAAESLAVALESTENHSASRMWDNRAPTIEKRRDELLMIIGKVEP